MSKKVYEENYIANIAEKIRSKTGKSTTYQTSEMPNGIEEVFEAGYTKSEDYFKDFLSDNYLTEFRVPDGTEKLRTYALSGTRNIKTITIPSSVFVLNNSAIRQNWGLEKVIFEGGEITTFGSNVFSENSKLKSVIFGCVIPNILNGTFYSCTVLEEVSLAQEEIKGSVYINNSSVIKKQCAYDIMKKLKNYKGTEKEYKYTLKLHNTTWANVEDTTAEDYEAPPASDTWQNYVQEIGYNI